MGARLSDEILVTARTMAPTALWLKETTNLAPFRCAIPCGDFFPSAATNDSLLGALG